MAEIFSFSPKSELDAKENLVQFIHQCKSELTVFGSDLDWAEWRWPRAGNFTKLGVNSRNKDEINKFDEKFIDFAKAYFRYQQGHKPTGAKNELKALRTIEAALTQSGSEASISNVTTSVLDQAAQLMRENYTKGSDYHGGRELERLAKFVTSKKLVSQGIGSWRNPIQRKKDEIQTGEKAKARRESKMPSEEALAALAEIFANAPSEPKDIFISSTFAMLMCAPSRISEILELPADCEVEQEDSKGVTRYGWRFYSGKGFGANIKWIPTEMIGIAKEAISRLRSLTSDARELATWIENNPRRFYRHNSCPDVTDEQPLSAIQVCQALGLANHSKKAVRTSLDGCKLDHNDDIYTLNSLWEYVLSSQLKGFPWANKEKGIRYGNSLFSMTRNLFHDHRGTSPVILWRPTNNVFNNDLSPRESLKTDHQSIFDRFGYRDSKGGRIKLTSHQARHLLNTIAQRGGLSQLQIAKWSGRADAKQNRTYNHMSEYEMVALAEELDTSLALFGPSGDIEKHIPVTIQEFNTLEKGAVHVTEFGVCVHDFTMSPCEKYRDCLNCSEQVCVKGEKDKLARIKKRFSQVENQFAAAEKAMQEGLAGADRWYEYHKNTLSRLQELVTILENAEIPDGAQIKLRNDKSFSPLRRAVESKVKGSSHSVGESKQILEDITIMLGGGLG